MLSVAHQQQALTAPEQLFRLRALVHPANDDHHASLTLDAALGRLTELSSATGTGTVSLAIQLVAEAQAAGESTAWVTTTATSFYPPDAADAGVNLDALVVVRLDTLRDVARAADRMLRSGGFGLVVLDLAAATAGDTPAPPAPLLSRIASQARHHHAAVVALTTTPPQFDSLSSLVALRLNVDVGPARTNPLLAAPFTAPFRLRAQALKDKRIGPFWSFEEPCHAPAGLR
jgi:recombination protein RecA